MGPVSVVPSPAGRSHIKSAANRGSPEAEDVSLKRALQAEHGSGIKHSLPADLVDLVGQHIRCKSMRDNHNSSSSFSIPPRRRRHGARYLLPQ